jgi:hypothetical protein
MYTDAAQHGPLRGPQELAATPLVGGFTCTRARLEVRGAQSRTRVVTHTRTRHDAIRTCFAWTTRLGGHAPFRLMPTAANRQPAFAFYSRWQGAEWRFHSVQVLLLEDDAVAKMTSFVVPRLSSAFDLPAVLPDDTASM